MTKENSSKGVVKGFGFNPVIGMVQWLPNTSNGAQTLIHAFGVDNVTRTGTGVSTVALTERAGAYVVVPVVASNDGNFHTVEVTVPTTTGFTVTHKTSAYGGASAANDNTGIVTISLLIYAVHN